MDVNHHMSAPQEPAMFNAQRILLAVSCLLCFGLLRHFWDHVVASGSEHAAALTMEGTAHERGSTVLLSANTTDSVRTDVPAPPHARTRYDCTSMGGLDDLVIVLKTGSTEIYEKLPIHLATTFVCVADFLIYSDLTQSVGSVQVRDALALVSRELREHHPDLAQYRMLQQHVRSGADAAELKGEKSWGLDKWKFLPMISDAYRLFGDSKKWYVFIEADTYVSTHNLRLWLSQLDAKQAIYAGAQVMIGDTEFAHGGSGFVMSASAAQGLTDAFSRRESDWEQKLADECCGDKLMAEVLLQAGPPITLLRAFPFIQGETLSSLDWSPTHWCMPAVTWHHVDAAGIDQLWQFEMAWRRDTGANKPIRFADYYAAFIHPRIATANGTMYGWDNLSNDWVFERGKIISPAYATADACKAFCIERQACLQWAWSPGRCRAGKAVRLGWAIDNRPELGSAEDRVVDAASDGDEGVVSGWLLDRIETVQARQGSCDAQQRWTTYS